MFAMLDWLFSFITLFHMKFQYIFHFQVLKYWTDSSIQKVFHDTFSLIYGKPIPVYNFIICQKRKINKLVQFGDATRRNICTNEKAKNTKKTYDLPADLLCLFKQVCKIEWNFRFWILFYVFFVFAPSISHALDEIARECESILSLLNEE